MTIDAIKRERDETGLARLDAAIIVGLGLLQGIAIYALVEAGKRGVLEDAPWLLRNLWGWALFLPPTAQWLIAHRRERGYWLLLAFVAFAVPALCWEPARVLTDATRWGETDTLLASGALAWGAIVSLGATAFGRGGWRDYPTLFRLTCRTALLPLGALLFTAIFSGLLVLWGALFDLIGIGFFRRLFDSEWLMWPVRGAVFGIATAILIDRPALVEGVRRAGSAIAAALLPLIVLIHLLFLGGLAVAGLEPLWATRHATPLVLTLLIAFLLALNGRHEDGTTRDRSAKPIAAAVRLAILLSPIYVGIAAYSLALRVQQYGWSPDRVTSACVIGFVGFVVALYIVVTLRKPFTTLPALARPNLVALIALALIAAALDSPILSPLRISAASQEARILEGRVAWQKIDWNTLAFDLGRYGREALERLASEAGSADVTLRQLASQALKVNRRDRYAREREGKGDRRFDEDAYTVIPGNGRPSAELMDAISRHYSFTITPHLCDDGCTMLAVDLNKDGEAEYVLLAGDLPVYYREDRVWRYRGPFLPSRSHQNAAERATLIAKLKSGAFELVPSEWSDLKIDGQRLSLRQAR